MNWHKPEQAKKEFLEKIERIIPFDEWIGIIRPCYYKGEHGNKPYDLELMLRIFIAAPSSTKNKDKKRDKDAHSVKKGNQWHFGYWTIVNKVDKKSSKIHRKFTSA